MRIQEKVLDPTGSRFETLVYMFALNIIPIKCNQKWTYPLATSFNQFGWNFQGLLAIVNLEFQLFIFLKLNLAFKIFQSFCKILVYIFFFLQRIFILFSCCPAELESFGFFNIFFRFWVLPEKSFLIFWKFILKFEKIYWVFGLNIL